MTRFARSLACALVLCGSGPAPAFAIVGGGATEAEGLGRGVVTIVGSRGNFCTGALIAPDVVLTAAHCVPAGANYKIVETGADRQPVLRDISRSATHPQYSAQAMAAHRVTADVALLKLAAPLKGKSALPYGAPRLPLNPGNRFAIAGVGVTVPGDGRSGGAVRSAALVATGQPGTLQIRLVDPATSGARAGLGACTGDSGAPAFESQDGRAVIIGVVSWSTGPNAAAGCGGLTGVTPLTRYSDWIAATLRGWGAM